MKTAILGIGCPKCRQTADVVRQAVEKAGEVVALLTQESVP